jgi:CheY-like chemotaxis protein
VERGIEMIGEVQPDLILLDIMFPEGKSRGFAAAGQIRGRYPQIPIFALTAINRQYAFDFNKEDIQAEEFLNKPVHIERLVKLINSYI